MRIYSTWAAGDAEGDAGWEYADVSVGRVFAEQFYQHDAALHQGAEPGLAQPLITKSEMRA